jgi:hypothetical protein
MLACSHQTSSHMVCVLCTQETRRQLRLHTSISAGASGEGTFVRRSEASLAADAAAAASAATRRDAQFATAAAAVAAASADSGTAPAAIPGEQVAAAVSVQAWYRRRRAARHAR